VVVGGSRSLCPPNARCRQPAERPLADGAAFAPATGSWRAIAPTPTSFANAEVAVVDGALYVGAGDDRLLRYRPDVDAWDRLPGIPGGASGYQLAPVGGDLVAYAGTDEQGERPDWRFTPGTARWEELPDDPLPPSYDRQVVADGARLLLFAKARHAASSRPPGRRRARGGRL
jgi:hypothetical protein